MTMEDPNKAALERIRLAIPRYRPGSGNNRSSSSSSSSSIGISTSTRETSVPLLGQNGNSLPMNQNHSYTTNNNNKFRDSAIDTNDTDEFEAEREIFVNLTTNKVHTVGKPSLPSSTSTVASSSSSSSSSPVTLSSSKSILPPNSSSHHHPPIPLSTATSVSSTQAQLMSSMTTRLQTVENAQKNLRSELVLRDREILTLKKHLDDALIEARANREALTQAQAILESSSSSSSVSSSTSAPSIPSTVPSSSASSSSSVASSSTAIQAATAMAEREKRYRNDIALLQEENASLRLRLSEMEQFLLDYGLVWVGNSTENNSTNHSTNHPSSSSVSSSASSLSLSSFPPIDFPVLIFKLKQLNSLAGEGKAQIIQKNGAHQFVARETINLVLFGDGFLLHRGPFRHWSESSSQMFLNDILDGYFPSEFQDTYPNGIIFDIQDKHTHYHNPTTTIPATVSNKSTNDATLPSDTHNNGISSVHRVHPSSSTNDTANPGNASSFVPFGGEGNKLVNPSSSSSAPTGSSSRPSTAANDSRVHSLSSVGDNQYYFGNPNNVVADNPLSKEEFLNTLPTRTITKDGNIVNLRDDILNTLGIPSSSSAATTSNVPSRSSSLSSFATATGSTTNSNNPHVSKNSVLIETTVLNDMRNQAQDTALASSVASSSSSPTPSPLLPYEVTTLQIRIDNNNRQSTVNTTSVISLGNVSILIAKLKYDNTIGELRNYIDTYFQQFNTTMNFSSSSIPYELRSMVPPKAYIDNTLTLRQAGLVPNATLVLRRL